MDEENPISLFGLPIPFKWDLFFVSAILVGGIIFMNTWDLPVYFSLLVGAFLLRQVKIKGWAGERIGEALTLAVPLGVLSFILYLPSWSVSNPRRAASCQMCIIQPAGCISG